MIGAVFHASRGSRSRRSPADAIAGAALAVVISAWSSTLAAQPAAGPTGPPEAATAINLLLFGKAATPSTAPGAPTDITIVRSLNPASGLKPADLSAFRERPLFAPSRRPLPPPAQVAAAPVVAPPPVTGMVPDLRLVGIIEVADQSVAILRRPSGGSALPLRVGDAVDDWRVASIAAESVVLRNGEREHSYALFSRTPASPAPTPPTNPGIPSGGISSILLKP